MRSLLRFVTCGSVDDGKSTLMGRLLHDCGAVPADQLADLAGQGGVPDYASLFDGLSAEREQGITIDVAHRYFSTTRRSFIVADAPGHEQYTRNMVTAASTADLAVVLVDATRGIQTQTRRHAFVVQALGVETVILAVSKMDAVGFDRARFDAIADAFATFARDIGIARVVAIPLSGLTGDNVCAPSAAMPWYAGPTLLAALEDAPADTVREQHRPLRMPVQGVVREGAVRGLSGLIAAGTVAPGDAVTILPSGRPATVAAIVASGGDLPRAAAGQSVLLTLNEAVDCTRGDVIVARVDPPDVADRFEATLIWLSDTPLVPGRGYWLKLATQTVSATVQPPKYAVNVDTLDKSAAKTLELNAIGVAELATDRPLVFEPYAQSRTLGGFILIDKLDNATVAAGMLHFALRRAHNIQWQETDVTREAHAALKHQRPAVLWLTGLSGAGKSTIANLVEKKLHALGRHTFLLDGDNLRHGLNKDLGFTAADRIENIRRVGEVARLMADAGLIVIAAFISPFRAERALVRAMMPPGEFIEIFVDTPLAEAEARDPKGLYEKARAGRLANFTGIDSPYEAPEAPDVRIDTMRQSAAEAADTIIAALLARDLGAT